MSFRWGRIPPEHTILVCPHMASEFHAAPCAGELLWSAPVPPGSPSHPTLADLQLSKPVAKEGGNYQSEKRSSLLGVTLEASRSESHIQVFATPSPLDCTAPPGAHDLACVSLGAGANSNVKIVLCIIYLFICAALSFLLVGSTLCHAVRLHKYLLWETVGGVAQCKEYEAGMEWRAKAV